MGKGNIMFPNISKEEVLGKGNIKSPNISEDEVNNDGIMVVTNPEKLATLHDQADLAEKEKPQISAAGSVGQEFSSPKILGPGVFEFNKIISANIDSNNWSSSRIEPNADNSKILDELNEPCSRVCASPRYVPNPDDKRNKQNGLHLVQYSPRGITLNQVVEEPQFSTPGRKNSEPRQHDCEKSATKQLSRPPKVKTIFRSLQKDLGHIPVSGGNPNEGDNAIRVVELRSSENSSSSQML